jgi:hypothetical protein
MRDFELDRPVDAVGVMAKNPPRAEEITPQALYVPFVLAAIAVIAYAYAAIVNQVGAGVAYYIAAGTEIYVS